MEDTIFWYYANFKSKLLRMSNVVQASDLDWTVVRPAGLTNNSVTDKEFTVKEDYHVSVI